ncbi:uncharacterized protein LOC123449683 isoform X1 [Hordeum vulgare subsp. vulgare]|uniref:DUF4378 domain-containing protein n=1 Tax=Hordeum vulgare subsp. vulgare TaxID=112509 RepID=A0A8I7B7N8_HORVV|nr:uncharacterized protein LOC123449683 isoform X1 [Hordeum vulgare subsp. vulgare]
MINLFDLSAGASARVATRDGSPVRGTQSDRKEYADLKTVTGSMGRSSSDRSAGGTPMKTLIAQEMAKEGDTNQKNTNVIARLMGLDQGVAFPKPVQPSSRRRSPEGHLSSTMARVNNQMSFDKHAGSVENVEYKDVYEVGYQPQRCEHLSNDSSQRGRPHEDHDQKRMDLVRQKFVEAKQLASHENLLQSKEFHDALETLNSNRDLFLKFLEEPNSLFAKQSGEFHSAPTSPQRKQITVLKPAKSVELKSENALKRQQNHAVHGSRTEKSNLHRKPNAGHAKAERCPQHTRIVVLKPTSAITSAEQFQQNGHGNSDDSDTPVVSRHVSDEIHWSAHGMCHQHDETQGSIQSNMVGRDRSYYDRAEEGRSSFSGSELGSPTSCHSWDYIYRFSNPYFGSSLSHASCSPEAHVAREGKKHASDRWPRASSNEIIREKVPMRRSLSTLGEMLAMSDMKKEDVVDQVVPNASSQLCGNEPRVAVPSNCSVDGAEGENSNKKISRSKSVPVSSSAFDSLRLDARSSDSQHREATTPKEAAKPRNGKSSLKGKISSFFSMRRKAGKEKPITSPSGSLNGRVPVDSDVVVGVSRSACTGLQDDVASENLEDKYQYATIVLPVKESEALSSSKALISLEKAHSFEIQNSHFDEPSPTSVLDALFEDRNEKSASSSESAITAKQEPLSRCLPIGSVARTLSWDDSSSEEAAPCSSKEEDSHEQEQYEFVEKILSSAGLCSVTTSDVFARWHSLDSPLAPNVPDQFLERKVEDAKRRERRSGQRLLIDSVNAALLDIGQSTLWSAYPCAGPVANVSRRDEPVADAAWRLVKGWLSDDEASNNGLPGNVGVAADRVVGEEIEGRGWSEMLRLEVDDMTKQICGDVLGEVVEEALSEFPRVPLMDAP